MSETWSVSGEEVVQPQSGRSYENEDVKILWDFNIQTDHLIEHRRPDIVVVNKKDSTCDIIDVAVPGDKRVNLTEIEKIENYSELCREVKKIWQLKEVRVIPIVIVSLGTISNNFEKKHRANAESRTSGHGKDH